jgi:CBS domain-containing protein
MTARDLMTSDPACCTLDTPLQEVARQMVQHDCGEIPVVERQDQKKILGVVTDRDIVCRAIADGKNPLVLDAAAVLSSPAVTVNEHDDIDEVIRVMETHQIRRVPVVDRDGECCGIISLADIARSEVPAETAELVAEVSPPSN